VVGADGLAAGEPLGVDVAGLHARAAGSFLHCADPFRRMAWVTKPCMADFSTPVRAPVRVKLRLSVGACGKCFAAGCVLGPSRVRCRVVVPTAILLSALQPGPERHAVSPLTARF
jgi:hypothetical protein